MATGELLRPGVEVIQEISTPAPSFVRPTLVPCVVGPAFEVLPVLSSDGTINSKAKYGIYSQLGRSIAENAFPSPRKNIDEVDVLEDSVKAYMLAGGVLTNLPLTNGNSFLAPSHVATKAALKSAVFGGAAGQALNGLVLTLSLDNPVSSDTSEDVTVVFVGSGPSQTGALTSQQACDQINTAVGKTIATVVYDTPGNTATDRILLSSSSYGALSSVTVRAGGSANAIFQLGYKNGDSNPSAHEERVEGSGYRGQDDNNNDTVTPWIEFYEGDYFLDGASTAFAAHVGLIDLDGVFTSAKHAAITFAGATPDIPLKVGDFVMVDGTRLRNGEVMKIEASRFKVGVINTALSVADDEGNYITKVYDAQQVGTPLDTNPFAPKYVYFVANNLNWRTATALPAKVTGAAVVPTAAAQAVLAGTAAAAGPLYVAGLRLHYVVTIDGVETEGTFTFTGGPYADDSDLAVPGAKAAMDKVAEAIGSSIPGVVAVSSTPAVTAGQLRLSSTKTGRLQKIVLKIDGTANDVLGFSTTDEDTNTASGADVSYTGLTGKLLKFSFDDNPHIYEVVAPSLSLDELIDEVNRVVGYAVASKDVATSTFLVLTSPLPGSASRVHVRSQNPTGAEVTLGLSTTEANGTGRPFPDAYMDDALVLHIGSELLRDQVLGTPLDQAYDSGQLYIQYRGLRKDVSAAAKDPGVVKLSDVDTLQSVLDPVTEDNPLGLAAYLCLLNAPSFEIKLLGVDEVTPAAPEGTGAAWARAAGMLEAEEVYAIAPLSQDETVQSMWMTHCSVMSAPDQGGERIVFPCKKLPNRRNPAIAISGSQANSTAQVNQLLLDANPGPGLVAAGKPGPAYSVDDAIYVELTVDNELRRYNVSSVSGSLVNLRTDFATTENTDDFFSNVTLDVPVVNSAYALKVRGSSLVVPGSNPARYDYQTMAETVAEANGLFKNRRVFEVFPETVKVVVNGVEKSLPGYYASAAIVGMVGAQPPQQGFTNFPITGVTGVVGTEKFTKRQLNIMAGGGTYILMQEVEGGAVFCRHQLSTDTTSVETRELSIAKVVDFTAKFLRLGVRRFIGTNNINDQLLDTLGATVHAICQFLVDGGVLNGFNVNNIAQDKDNPDTVLIDVTLDVPYPCNYIRLTLVL